MPNFLRGNGGNSGTCYETLAKIGLAIDRVSGDALGPKRSRPRAGVELLLATKGAIY